jgi:diguanylate cyclase (GGDEF)-like protein/PAS domain S-box-containing protein
LNQNHPINNSSDNDCDALQRRIQELEKRCRQAENALQKLEEQYRILGDSSLLGIFTIKTDGYISGINRKMKELLGWPSNRGIAELNIFQYAPLVDSGVVEAFQFCLEKNTRLTRDYPCPSDSAKCFLRYHISPLIDKDERSSGVIAFVEDITEIKLAEKATLASEEKYRLLFESAPVAMIERNASELKQHLEQLQADGISDFRLYFEQYPEKLIDCMNLIKTVKCNNAFRDLMEAQNWEEIRIGIKMTNNPDYLRRIALETVLMVADGCISKEQEFSIATVKGTQKTIMAKSLPLTGHEDTLASIVLAMVDITKRKEAQELLLASEQKFRELAIRDNLTGLYNRRYLFQSMEELDQYAKNKQLIVSVIFMDLDRFKEVVDTYGHLNGSLVIKEVGQTIQATLNIPDFAVAYAGDEFVVVLHNCDLDQALDKAKAIQNRIKNRIFLQDHGLEVRIQSSFGIAVFPYQAENMTDLLAAADKALFAAKGAGKDTIKSAT